MPNLIISDIQVRQDAEGRYSLNDLHKAAGGEDKHQPALFLRLDSTHALVDEITRSTEMQIDPVVSKKGGFNQGTFVCIEPGVRLRHVDKSRLPPESHPRLPRANDPAASRPGIRA
jgi:hypothetical protein